MAIDRAALERLYRQYNRREFVHPDPLELLYRYDDVRDREIAGLVASSLAYGRVMQIIGSVSTVLDAMPSPAAFLTDVSEEELRRLFSGFRHRFTQGEELIALLLAVREAIRRFGSLHACALDCFERSGGETRDALTRLSEILAPRAGECGSLMPSPSRGSACKRLNLYLRWMVRSDAVDPGGWDGIPPAALVVPLDTHMFAIARALELTGRRQPDWRAAEEITEAFRTVSPQDPVRYDFALTRLGIRRDADRAALLRECAGEPSCVAERKGLPQGGARRQAQLGVDAGAGAGDFGR